MRTTAQKKKKKKIHFKISPHTDSAPGHPRAGMDMYKDINVDFLLVDKASILELFYDTRISKNIFLFFNIKE